MNKENSEIAVNNEVNSNEDLLISTEKEKKNQGRVIYLDIIRIVAMFSIMLLHVSSSELYTLPVDSKSWLVIDVYNCLVRYAVPIFFMVSGIFFLDLDRKYTIKGILTKNVFRLGTAFLFWTTVYLIKTKIALKMEHTFYPKRNMLDDFVLGNYHMWFIYAIIGLYLIVPFLREIQKNKKLVEYFLILFFIFTLMSTFYNSFQKLAILPFGRALDKFNVHFVMGYTGLFFLGRYLYDNKLSKRVRRTIYILGFISIIFNIVMSVYLSLKAKTLNFKMYEILLPTTIFYTMMIFIFARDYISKIKFSERARNIIFYISKISFGMYLVHDIFNFIIFKVLKYHIRSFNPILSVPVYSIIIFICSFLVCALIDRTKYLKKYIM